MAQKTATPSRKPSAPAKASAPAQKSGAVARKGPSPVSTGRGTAAAPARARVAPAPAPEPEEILDETPVEETASESFVEGQDEVLQEAEGASGDEILDLSTEELDAPSRKADAHRGRIVEIVEWHSEQKGTPAFRVVLHSDDADFDVNCDVYVPLDFEADIRINPKELSKGEKDPETGKIVGNSQMQYAMSIHNKKNEAFVDRLRAIAKSEGRSLAGYTEPVDDFPQFVAALNFLGADLPVVFRRNPDRQNPRFLRVEDILPIGSVEDPKSQGLFKGRVKAWETQE